jgi:Domain of unknown function (DUF4124)
MNRRFASHVVLVAAAAALFAPPVALAEVLYKLIDKNGKVTYSEEKPKNFDGQVIRLDIDLKANTATMPRAASGANSGEPNSAPRGPADGKAKKKPSTEELIAKARERLENAQKALQEARDNPADGDMQIIGNKGPGTRMVPTAEYQKKLERLQQEVKNAEEELRRAESAG